MFSKYKINISSCSPSTHKNPSMFQHYKKDSFELSDLKELVGVWINFCLKVRIVSSALQFI